MARREVYKTDATARQREMSPEQRLAYHQANSGPLMKELKRACYMVGRDGRCHVLGTVEQHQAAGHFARRERVGTRFANSTEADDCEPHWSLLILASASARSSVMQTAGLILRNSIRSPAYMALRWASVTTATRPP